MALYGNNVVAMLLPVPEALVTAPVEIVEDHSGAREDDELVDLWIARQRSDRTKHAYRHDAGLFLDFLGKTGRTLRTTTVRELQAWIDQLSGSVATRARRIAAVKSLLSFGQRVGYLRFNVGGAVSSPSVPNDLAERILSENEVRALLGAVTGRDGVLLRFLYATGARISEACSLCFEHLHRMPTGLGVVTLHGKGGKTRHVAVSERMMDALVELGRGEQPETPVFRTRSQRPLLPANVAKTIRAAAKRAGVERKVSAHWFRHAHASHALERGASIALVKESLGHASLSTTSLYTHARPGDSAGLYLGDDVIWDRKST